MPPNSHAEVGDPSRTHHSTAFGCVRGRCATVRPAAQDLAANFQDSTSFWTIPPPLQPDKQNPRQQATLLKLDLCKENFPFKSCFIDEERQMYNRFINTSLFVQVLSRPHTLYSLHKLIILLLAIHEVGCS